MIERELEAMVRQAWTDSNLPLTDENVARLSGMPRTDVEHGMRQLMRKGVVDMDVDATGSIVWCVRGLQRVAEAMPPTSAAPPQPPSTETVTVKPEPTVKSQPTVKAQPAARPESTALVAEPRAEPRTATPEPPKPPTRHVAISVPGIGLNVGFATDPERKSILLSGGASLLFGPFGWLYAAPWKEVVPAIALYTALVALFPKFLVATLLGVLHPACGVLGMLYAYRYNQTKQRTPLLLTRKTLPGVVPPAK